MQPGRTHGAQVVAYIESREQDKPATAREQKIQTLVAFSKAERKN